MKKVSLLFVLMLLVSCGEAPAVFVSKATTPWGTISLSEGWVVKSQEGSNLRLESQLEENTELTIKEVKMPQDLEGWAKSFIEASGRTLDRSGNLELGDKNYLRYDLSALVGRDTIGEMLVLIPYGDKLLAVDAFWKSKSVLAKIPEEMVKSIVIGGK
jgi:hypothetical protein